MTRHTCIHCGDASRSVDASNFDTIFCGECDSEFTIAEVENVANRLLLLVRCCKAGRALIDAESMPNGPDE